ncbi:MAG TPA: hypothetical protein PK011_05535 [Marinagarivorans sp.]|nr:hypothetical protein [Marinagarivorans sp.]
MKTVKLYGILSELGSIFNSWLEFRWKQIQHLFSIIHETRFSFFVVVVTSVVLLLNDQGREIAVSAGDFRKDVVLYPIATLWLAVQVWFWARIILSAKYPRSEDRPDFTANVFPRCLAVITCLIPGIALSAAIIDGQGGEYVWGVLAALILSSVLFLVIIVFRRELNERLRTKMGVRKSADPDTSPVFVWLSLGMTGVSTLVAWIAPLWLGATLGTVPTLMLGLAGVVCVGSYLVFLTRKSSFPTVTFLVFTSVILSSCTPYYIRLSAPYELHQDNRQPGDTRPKLIDEFTRWKGLQGEKSKTLIVVAASGGGITAAYWTSSLLATFQDIDPEFAPRLFLISSVSGGSVGAAVFTQALTCEMNSADMRKKIAAVLGEDLLTPVLGTALFTDMFFWAPGPSILAHYEVKPMDRAIVFETRLEEMWREHFSEQKECSGLDQDFLKQRSLTGKWQPILMLNSTHQETGRPVIQSQVKLADEDLSVGRPFETAIDLFSVARHDLRISTAAHNSARFPLVSPAGQIRPEPGKPALKLGRLIDGGYFENAGAYTLMQSLIALGNRLDNMQVVVIQISIDSPRPFEPDYKTAQPEFIADQVARAPHVANDLLSPVFGFFVARDSHQEDVRDRLRAWTLARGQNGVYLHFRALIPEERRDKPDPVKPPLGWRLSGGSQEQLLNRTLCLDRNYKEWEKLAPVLGDNKDKVQLCGPSKADY